MQIQTFLLHCVNFFYSVNINRDGRLNLAYVNSGYLQDAYQQGD